MVIDWYWHSLTKDKREEGLTIFQVHKEALNGGFYTKALTKYEEMSIASILRDGLRLERKQVMKGGTRSWRWFWNGPEPENVGAWYDGFIIEDKK